MPRRDSQRQGQAAGHHQQQTPVYTTSQPSPSIPTTAGPYRGETYNVVVGAEPSLPSSHRRTLSGASHTTSPLGPPVEDHDLSRSSSRRRRQDTVYSSREARRYSNNMRPQGPGSQFNSGSSHSSGGSSTRGSPLRYGPPPAASSAGRGHAHHSSLDSGFGSNSSGRGGYHGSPPPTTPGVGERIVDPLNMHEGAEEAVYMPSSSVPTPHEKRKSKTSSNRTSLGPLDSGKRGPRESSSSFSGDDGIRVRGSAPDSAAGDGIRVHPTPIIMDERTSRNPSPPSKLKRTSSSDSMKAQVGDAEEAEQLRPSTGSSEQRGCRRCQRMGHRTKECPLVVDPANPAVRGGRGGRSGGRP